MKGSPRSSIQHSILVPSIIAIVCYANILPNDFCFDDVAIVRDNPKIQYDNQWGAVWKTDYWSHTGQDAASRDLLYRPVTLSLLRLTRIVAGNQPVAFHIVSLFLHALCTLLVALLVRSVFRAGTAHRAVAPMVAAAIFAVLPIHSEAVASVVGQADLLATAGTIGAILCHLRLTGAVARPQAALWMAASAGCAFLAMGAKESGICVVPLVCLAELLGVTTRHASAVTLAPLPERGGRSWLPVIFRLSRALYLLVPLGLYLALRYDALGAFYQGPAPTKTVNVLVDAPAWQHLLGVLQAWGMYWSKTVIPRELAIEYAINAVQLPTSILQAHVLTGFIWIAALLNIAVISWRNGARAKPFLVFALIISYLPTSNLFVLIQVFFAERIWYLPSVFVAGLFAIFGVRLLERRIWRRVGVLLLCAMMVRCWVRNSEWKNNGTLFAAAYFDHPQSVMARHLYGQWLTQHGEIERGIGLIQKALEIDLGFTDAHRSLGHAYLKAGQVEDALRHLQIADMQAPGHAQTKEQLSQVADRLESESRQELEELKKAAQANPEDWEKQLLYARLLRSVGKTKESLHLLQESADRFGDNPEWAAELATGLVLMNRRDDAIEAYWRSLELDPKHAQRSVELAMLLLERRCPDDLDDAARLVKTAIDLAPQSPSVHAAKAEVLALQGDVPGARESFRRAIQLSQPESNQSRILLERLNALGQ